MTAPESSPKPAEAIAELAALIEFFDGSAHPEFQGAEPTVRINGQDYLKMQALIRRIQESEAAAIQRGDGQTDARYWEIIGKYTGEVIGVCTRQEDVLAEEPVATFNEISRDAFEAYGDDPWTKPGQHNVATPPAAKPDETSGATPVAQDAAERIIRMHESICASMQRERDERVRELNEARAQLAALKSAGRDNKPDLTNAIRVAALSYAEAKGFTLDDAVDMVLSEVGSKMNQRAAALRLVHDIATGEHARFFQSPAWVAVIRSVNHAMKPEPVKRKSGLHTDQHAEDMQAIWDEAGERASVEGAPLEPCKRPNTAAMKFLLSDETDPAIHDLKEQVAAWKGRYESSQKLYRNCDIKLGEALRELAAVRKSAGAAGADTARIDWLAENSIFTGGGNGGWYRWFTPADLEHGLFRAEIDAAMAKPDAAGASGKEAV